MSVWKRVGAGLGAAALLTACQDGSVETRPPPAVDGERLVVAPQEVADLKPVAAVITTRDMSEARARVGGILVSLNVKEGDMVRRGQVIGRIADDRIGLQTRAFGAQSAAAGAEASRAAAELERIRDLYANGVYAKARLDQAEASAKAAQGMLDAARAQQAASAELGAQGALLAPAAGRVLTADVPVGSFVAPGQMIAAITAGPTVLRVDAPESAARTVTPGAELIIDDPALPGLRSVKVTEVYPNVANGVVRIDAALPGVEPSFVGMRSTVMLPAGKRTALVIPRRFVTTRFGIDYVRVQTAGGVTETPVQLAPAARDDQAEVLAGLAARDVIVAAPVKGAAR